MLLSQLLVTVSLSFASVYAATDAIASTSFTNSIRYLFDVDGNQIDAYGSKVNYFNGSYYLYGNSFAITGSAFGIKSYSSVDLKNWVFEGYLYDPYVSNPCDQLGGCGRPHILFSQSSQKYILWANAGSSGYVVATSSSPSSDFVFEPYPAMIDPAFNGLQPADFAVETFGNKGYLVFSALNFRDPRAGSLYPPIFQTLHISPLTSDLMNTTGVSYNITSSKFDLVDQETESPDIFMRNGIFYVAASNTCGYCNGSIGLIYRSTSIKGPWTRQIISGYSCEGQVEGVLPLLVPKTGYTAYVWHSTSVPGGPRTGFGGHIFQPLVFNKDGSVKNLNCAASASFTVDFKRGKGAVGSGAATSAADGSPLLADYQAVCDSDLFMLHQTWTASKTGTLTQVGVNIAGAGGRQSTDLTLHVFKFSNLTALTSPEYKYTSLASLTVPSSSLSYVFNTTFIPVNAAVTKGDNLGLSIAGADFTPYCHLEYDLSSSTPGDTSLVLFQQGSGQYSLRGLNGMNSPVYVRAGKGVKFFANVE